MTRSKSSTAGVQAFSRWTLAVLDASNVHAQAGVEALCKQIFGTDGPKQAFSLDHLIASTQGLHLHLPFQQGALIMHKFHCCWHQRLWPAWRVQHCHPERHSALAKGLHHHRPLNYLHLPQYCMRASEIHVLFGSPALEQNHQPHNIHVSCAAGGNSCKTK